MKTTHSLKAGESLAVNGTVTIIRCGTLSEGDAPPVPVVDLEVETADAAPAAAPADADPAAPASEDANSNEHLSA